MSLNVYYAEANQLDCIHAERLRETPTLLHRFDYGEHDLVKALRDSGWLRDLLLGFGDKRGMPERKLEFLMQFGDPDHGLACDLEPDSDTLVVAFGGIAGGLGTPPFEFFRILSRIGVKKAFVRDHHQAWYHRGVKGVGRDIDAVSRHLRELCAGRRAIFVGNSAGGYAALLFGAAIGAEVHAFSPQTFISHGLRKEHGDRRWQAEIGAFTPDPRYEDLLPLLGE
jgi:hypothetical protein